MILIKNVTLYDPQPQGKKDVLIGGGKFLKIADTIDASGLAVKTIDRTGYVLVPGLIDNHVHLTGGGGEAGYASSVPEIQLRDFIDAGITTAIGLLGTDGFTRSMSRLIAKAKALKAEGMSVYVLSGSYQMPVKTFTDSVENDLLFIEEIIGAGEIAISDHRSSQPTLNELRKTFASVHVGGLLSGKGGVLNLHVGSGKDGLKPIAELIKQTDLPAQKLIPTHINRNETLLEAGIAYSKTNHAPIDFTAYSHKDDDLSAYKALAHALEAGVEPSLITLSSDGQGSLPVFDESGNFIKMGVGSVSALFDNLTKAITTMNSPLEIALQTVTSNVATLYHLKGKGYIKEGYDADAVILSDAYALNDVLMRGVFAKENQINQIKGTFE